MTAELAVALVEHLATRFDLKQARISVQSYTKSKSTYRHTNKPTDIIFINLKNIHTDMKKVYINECLLLGLMCKVIQGEYCTHYNHVEM
jgi:hypothetical protein